VLKLSLPSGTRKYYWNSWDYLFLYLYICYKST